MIALEDSQLAAPDVSTEAAQSLSCSVKLSSFEGPLDLLLHLIRANEVDIGDIPISLISEQYLSYLEMMRMLDIDVAADYLVTAATLAHIKSRMLLPPDPDGDEEEGKDPRAELARRLAEYAVYKDAAQDLSVRPRLGREVFSGEADLSDVPQTDPVLHGTIWSLLQAMKRVLDKLPDEELHHEVLRESITVHDRMIYLMDLLATQPPGSPGFVFEELLTDARVTRQRVVMTFLAILELAKIQALAIHQSQNENNEPVGPVRIRASVTPADASVAAE